MITDKMVEAACESHHGAENWKHLPEPARANYRNMMRAALQAAQSAAPDAPRSGDAPVATIHECRDAAGCMCDWFSADDAAAIGRLPVGTKLYTTTVSAPAQGRDGDTVRMDFVDKHLFGSTAGRRASGLLRFFPRARNYPNLDGISLRDAIDRALSEAGDAP